jgi:hypothetical protein
MMLLATLGSTSARAGGLDSWNWHPRADSITIERAGDAPGTPGSGAVLRVHGRIESGWNYIALDRHPVTPGGFYRLSAWLRVDRRGSGTPMPFLKCEFVAEGTRGSSASRRPNGSPTIQEAGTSILTPTTSSSSAEGSG